MEYCEKLLTFAADKEIIMNMKNKEDLLIGQKFNMLTVMSQDDFYVKPNGNKEKLYTCLCDCGKVTKTLSHKLKSGHTKSCGCLWLKTMIKHNLSDTKEYNTWNHIKQRCHNPNDKAYKDYGGRGITVCDEWRDSFETFLEDMGKAPTDLHTIDRSNNTLGYSKENCKWVTRKEQQNNTRSNVIIEFEGRIKTLAEWAEYLNFNEKLLRSRYCEKGYTFEEAIHLPKNSIRDLKIKSKAEVITYNNTSNSLYDWSIFLNIPLKTLQKRLNLKWSIEKTLTTPHRIRKKLNNLK